MPLRQPQNRLQTQVSPTPPFRSPARRTGSIPMAPFRVCSVAGVFSRSLPQNPIRRPWATSATCGCFCWSAMAPSISMISELDRPLSAHSTAPRSRSARVGPMIPPSRSIRSGSRKTLSQSRSQWLGAGGPSPLVRAHEKSASISPLIAGLLITMTKAGAQTRPLLSRRSTARLAQPIGKRYPGNPMATRGSRLRASLQSPTNPPRRCDGAVASARLKSVNMKSGFAAHLLTPQARG